MLHDNILTFSVSELNQQIKDLLENTFMTINVTGEISNLVKASSGHVYFTLKDQKAQIRCAFFKTYQRSISPALKEGSSIIITGKLSLFEAKGDYQLIVYQISSKGAGILSQELEALKNKLTIEGLFEQKHKKPLPLFPHTIGIISSPQGAALRDILITLYHRFPLANIIIYPSEVQGQNAASQLIKAFNHALHENKAEVIILARGGGSIEDLWPFNDETLIRTMFHAKIPIITGVGHETDFTLADFVADLRAATPTAAAVAATPDKHYLKETLKQQEQDLVNLLMTTINNAQENFILYQNRLERATPQINAKIQLIDYYEQKLKQFLLTLIHHQKDLLYPLSHRLISIDLKQKLYKSEQKSQALQQQLLATIKNIILIKNQLLELQTQSLHTLSPLTTLNRGYAIVSQDKKIILDISAVNPHNPIAIRLAKGLLTCKVLESS